MVEPTTCGCDIPDSPSTRHAHRGNSGGYDADRKPVSSANVHAKTPGGPRRARTDDLRIKRAIWVCGLTRILLISCVIASQRLARRGGRSRARADSLRTLSVFHWLRRVSRRCPRRIPQACDPSRRSSPPVPALRRRPWPELRPSQRRGVAKALGEATRRGDSEDARAAVERAAVERHAEARFKQDAAGTALDRREGST